MNGNLKEKDNKGFSLIELVIVISVLSILAAVAIPNFICVIRKSKATAALNALANVRKECIAKKLNNVNPSFNNSNVNGYTISNSRNSYECNPSSQEIIASPNNSSDELPSFIYNTNTDDLKYTYKGITGTDFTECLGMICGDGARLASLPPNESTLFGPDSGLSCREAKSLPAGISSEYVYLSGRSRLSVPIVPVDISIGNKSWRIEDVTSPIDNTYSDKRWLETFAEAAVSVINDSDGDYSAEIDPNNSQSIKIYGPTGDIQKDIKMKIDSGERGRLSRGVYPYAVPSLGTFNDNWDENKQAYVINDESDGQTTTVCDGR